MVTNGLAWIRHRQRPLARTVLALFCLAWLQFALVPCAAAASGGMTATAEAHCPYCPPAEPAPDQHCRDTVPASCTYPDDPQLDTRAVHAAAAALPPMVPVVMLAPILVDAVRLAESYEVPAPRRTPLSVRYCRYLK